MQPVKLKGASVFRGPLQKPPLERNLLRLRIERRFVRDLLFLGAVELTDGIRLDLPHLERRGDLAFAFAELLLVSAVHECGFDVDAVAFSQPRRSILAEAIPGNTIPFRLGVPSSSAPFQDR
jgi:hypothetical protein